MRHAPRTAVWVGVVAFVGYAFCSFKYHQNRNDFFLLADAFLHGRTWIPGPELAGLWDRIDIAGRTYVPFAPLPGLVFMPLVALFGVPALSEWHFLVNSILAATCVVLGYVVIGRFGSDVVRDRLWLTALFALSTPILSITVSGGPWHQGQLLATICSLAAILEARGGGRPVLLGALGGAAFLARSPTIFALPFYTWAASRSGGRRVTMANAARAVVLVATGAAPAITFSLLYNVARFGSPTESGYALASLPPFLEALREQGLFSLAHVPRNLEYFLLHRPVFDGPPLFIRPDGFGTSVLITSPGLLVGASARPRDPFLVACALTALAVFLPSLLYYGGGWSQAGFRYFLDAIPFLLPLVAASSRSGLGVGWKALIAAGIVVNLWTVPWTYGF